VEKDWLMLYVTRNHGKNPWQDMSKTGEKNDGVVWKRQRAWF